MLNAFTVDVEDYFQVSAFERRIDRRNWGDYESRVVASTRKILDLLDEHDVQATFFVLGWVADRHPRLIREIAAAGHEVGSHSYWHRLVYRQTPAQFRRDLRRSKHTLEDIISEPVTVYRAPSFSITKQSTWALEILAEEGIFCDSSIFPVRHDRYGMPDCSPQIHLRETPQGSLWEFPPAVLPSRFGNLPISGGGYFRLYPFAWSLAGLRWINRSAGRPFVFYVHPWEVDPEQPRLRAGSRLARVRHYVNLASTEKKLRRLLKSFEFAPVSKVIQAASLAPIAAESTPSDPSPSPIRT